MDLIAIPENNQGVDLQGQLRPIQQNHRTKDVDARLTIIINIPQLKIGCNQSNHDDHNSDSTAEDKVIRKNYHLIRDIVQENLEIHR